MIKGIVCANPNLKISCESKQLWITSRDRSNNDKTKNKILVKFQVSGGKK